MPTKRILVDVTEIISYLYQGRHFHNDDVPTIASLSLILQQLRSLLTQGRQITQNVFYY